MAFKIVIGIVALILYVAPLGGITVFNSPDENANATFASYFAQHSTLRIPALYMGEGAEYFAPRSVVYRNGYYVPGSFIGLPLFYGLLSKIIPWVNLLTPLFAVLGVLAFWGILRRIFSARIATISALLLLIHPAWWYFASRGMFPNILLVSLVLIGIYFLLRHEGVRLSLSAGFLIALALLVRPSEMVWVTPIIIVLLWCKPWSHVVSFLVPLAFGVVVLLYANTVLYGAPFSFAYQPPSLSEFSQESPGFPTSYKLQALFSYLFPFGFHPRLALKNFLDYGVELFWWLSALAFIGFRVLNNKKAIFIYVYTFLALIFIYGSGRFIDHPNPNVVSLGNSYVRYWLPLYVLSIPLIAYRIDFFMSWRRRPGLRAWIPAFAGMALGCVLLIYNTYFVFASSDVSLLSIRTTLQGYQMRQEKVLSLTPEDAIIIAGRYDKLLWPQRTVAFAVSDGLVRILPTIAKTKPLYYYAWLRDTRVLDRDQALLAEVGLQLQDGVDVAEGEQLMKILPL